MSYTTRRRQRTLVYLLVAFFLMAPGFGTRTVEAASRTSTHTREAKLETFRNPQFSSSSVNRFLYPLGPKSFASGGGQSLKSPGSRGYGSGDGPPTLWLPNGGRVEWAETDLALPGVGLPLQFQRIWRGSVTDYDGPLGREWV